LAGGKAKSSFRLGDFFHRARQHAAGQNARVEPVLEENPVAKWARWAERQMTWIARSFGSSARRDRS